MTLKRKRKIQKRKIAKQIAKDFIYKMINGTSIEEAVDIVPQGLLKDILKGGINDR